VRGSVATELACCPEIADDYFAQHKETAAPLPYFDFAQALTYRALQDLDWVALANSLPEEPTAKWSELRYGLRGQLEDHDGQAAQA
jgi:hypothetical protein